MSIHNHSFRKVIKDNDECIKDNFDLFYNKLKDSSYKIEHYSLNNFKVIFDNITLTLEKDKSLTDRIEELEEENKSIKELLIEIKNNQKPSHKLYNKVGDKIYEGELINNYPVYGKAYSEEELIYEGYFMQQKYYGEGKLYEKNKIKEEGKFIEGKLVKGTKYIDDDFEKGISKNDVLVLGNKYIKSNNLGTKIDIINDIKWRIFKNKNCCVNNGQTAEVKGSIGKYKISFESAKEYCIQKNYGCFVAFRNKYYFRNPSREYCLKDVLKYHVNDDECITYIPPINHSNGSKDDY